MLGTFLLVLPFAFAGALSPMMLTEQTLLLATSGGRPAATRYAIGACVTLLGFIGLVTFFGRVVSLPAEPTLSASLDILLGLFLLLAAIVVVILRQRVQKPERPGRKRRDHPVFGPSRALGFGVFSMATNLTTLALMIPAAKLIAASGADLPGRTALILVVAVIASTPAWLPVVLTGLAPGPAERALGWTGRMIEVHGRQFVVVLLAVLGALLVVRGIVETIRI